MFGAVLSITKKSKIAETIFIEAFIDLSKNTIMQGLSGSHLAVLLFMYAKEYTLRYLKERR